MFNNKVASQLNSDDLKSVGPALIIPLTAFQPSSISALILDLDLFFRTTAPEFVQREDVHFADKL